jgi:hypothetical protein
MARPRAKKPEAEIVINEPKIALSFTTTNMKVTELLNRKGIAPSECYGYPMVFSYAPDKTQQILELIKAEGIE